MPDDFDSSKVIEPAHRQVDLGLSTILHNGISGDALTLDLAGAWPAAGVVQLPAYSNGEQQYPGNTLGAAGN